MRLKNCKGNSEKRQEREIDILLHRKEVKNTMEATMGRVKGGVRELPKVKIDSKTYYLDLRLNQLRNTQNPHEFRDFGSQFDLLDFIVENHLISMSFMTSLINQYVI